MSKINTSPVKTKLPFDLYGATDVLYDLFEIKKKDIYGVFKCSIKQPYTEPLALELLPSILSEQYIYRKGNPVADIIADDGHKKYKIEIKTTIEPGFTCLGSKDITADFLIWIHFNDFFMSRDNTHITIYIVKDAFLMFDDLSEKEKSKLRCIKLNKFIDIVEENLTVINFNLKEFIFGK